MPVKVVLIFSYLLDCLMRLLLVAESPKTVVTIYSIFKACKNMKTVYSSL